MNRIGILTDISSQMPIDCIGMDTESWEWLMVHWKTRELPVIVHFHNFERRLLFYQTKLWLVFFTLCLSTKMRVWDEWSHCHPCRPLLWRVQWAFVSVHVCKWFSFLPFISTLILNILRTFAQIWANDRFQSCLRSQVVLLVDVDFCAAGQCKTM